jgi:hypothetical protein
LELCQIQNDEGPCLDCLQTGEVIGHSNLNLYSPWHRFSKERTEAGFASMCGANASAESSDWPSEHVSARRWRFDRCDVASAQALADVATVVIIQDQAGRDAAIRERHLSHALTSRIAIEQKGLSPNVSASSWTKRLRVCSPTCRIGTRR